MGVDERDLQIIDVDVILEIVIVTLHLGSDGCR